MFSFTYRLDDKDYYEFNKYHLYNSPINKKRILLMRFGAPAIYLLLGLFMGSMAEHPMTYYVVFGTIAVAWVVFFRPINNRALKKNLARIKKVGKLPFQSNITLTFLEDCFIEKTDVNETKTNYSIIERIVDTDTGVYIYNGAVSAYIMPNAAFKDNGERTALIAYLHTKMQEAAFCVNGTK